nr:MAG TPA: hypothetical protein [Caudoviricetes sp.]
MRYLTLSKTVNFPHSIKCGIFAYTLGLFQLVFYDICLKVSFYLGLCETSKTEYCRFIV